MSSFLLMIALVLDIGAAPTCETLFGHVACGYHCVSNLTQMACAQTPEGLCVATPGAVVCWDPPPDVPAIIDSDRDDLPQPSCITSINGAACGYFCTRTGDKVACANSPMGGCGTSFDAIQCWDPAPEVRWQMEAEGDYRAASCEKTLGGVKCGYSCVASLKRIACAQTPWGFCDRSGDVPYCWDPLVTPPMASTVDKR